jgi:hypothetical protein
MSRRRRRRRRRRRHFLYAQSHLNVCGGTRVCVYCGCGYTENRVSHFTCYIYHKDEGKVAPVLLTEHHAMKAYYGSEGIAPRILDLGTWWRWMVSSMPRPLYPQGKSPWYPLDRRLGGPQSLSGRGGEEKNSQSLPESEPPHHPSHSPALYLCIFHMEIILEHLNHTCRIHEGSKVLANFTCNWSTRVR